MQTKEFWYTWWKTFHQKEGPHEWQTQCFPRSRRQLQLRIIKRKSKILDNWCQSEQKMTNEAGSFCTTDLIRYFRPQSWVEFAEKYTLNSAADFHGYNWKKMKYIEMNEHTWKKLTLFSFNPISRPDPPDDVAWLTKEKEKKKSRPIGRTKHSNITKEDSKTLYPRPERTIWF